MNNNKCIKINCVVYPCPLACVCLLSLDCKHVGAGIVILCVCIAPTTMEPHSQLSLGHYHNNKMTMHFALIEQFPAEDPLDMSVFSVN